MLICASSLPSSMFSIHKYTFHFQRLSQPGIRALVLPIVLIAFAVFSFQMFTVNPGNSSSPLFPAFGKTSSSRNSSSVEIVEAPLSSDSRTREVQKRGFPVSGGARDEHHGAMDETDGDPDDPDLDEEESQDDDFSIDLGNGARLRKVKDPHGGYLTVEKSPTAGNSSSVVMVEEQDTAASSTSSKGKERNLDNAPSPSPSSFVAYPESSSIARDTQRKRGSKPGDSGVNMGTTISSSGKKETRTNQTIARSEVRQPLQSAVANPNCALAKDFVREKKRNRSAVTIAEMDQILLMNRGSSCSKRPQWLSPTDRQILKAKKQILKAPIVENDSELYAPAFRNLSTFKRSYDLMEKVLKVYVYKEGDAPIFHHPPLTGIYASEGWFMKNMEGRSRFLVNDPSKAHLFYIPFSSRNLCSQLYVPDSHSSRNLVNYLKTYMGTIAGKYPFWNRTGGADHFLAACHDWAASETSQAMGGSIRALCNADVTVGFELGKDVSLPETNIPKADPLWGLGGRPVRKRPLLAFFSGQMHGYLRPLLFQHWENRDPGMKLFGEGDRKKGEVYAQYMRSSKYCICPRGYEVNSPRVVEAIFYECVPVIISDNFVPPFFEVLNWAAFSVVVAEKDVPRLKEVLTAIPKKRYLALQAGVKRVQRHFLWHKLPVKYDLFHMILHSVWLNRVYNF